MNYERRERGPLLQTPGRAEDVLTVRRGLTFLLDVQEAFHRPLAWRFIVLVRRPYPLHQLLHFLLGAHKVVPRLHKSSVYRMFGQMAFFFPKCPIFQERPYFAYTKT